jgi:bifunctional ADP-heptose synthase (sugar kinase/adenylyltransferase)
LAWDGQRFWYSSSYRVRAIDTTGAGDLFHAGFSYGVLKAWDWQRVMDFSCAAAGLNCTALGAREGIHSFDDIEAFRRDAQRNAPAYSSAQLEGAAAQATRRASGTGRLQRARQFPARAMGK